MDRDTACNLMAVLGSRQATDIHHLLPAEGAADGMTITTVARTLSLPPSTVARQLAALIRVGLASKVRRGRLVDYRRRREPLDELSSYLVR